MLHYIDYPAQRRVLERLQEALTPGGRLLLRIGDADAGLHFRISNWVDHTVTFVRGHRLPRLHCRSLAQWLEELRTLGFDCEPVAASQGTPFAYVLLVARPNGKPSESR